MLSEDLNHDPIPEAQRLRCGAILPGRTANMSILVGEFLLFDRYHATSLCFSKKRSTNGPQALDRWCSNNLSGE